MVPITLAEFAKNLGVWFDARYINGVQFLAGGWEVWIQADLCSYLYNINSEADIQREVGIYNTQQQRVDLLLNAQGRYIKDYPLTAIEIKAQSVKSGDNFIDAVKQDEQKLGANNLREEYKDATRIVLAFIIDGNTATQFSNWSLIHKHQDKVFIYSKHIQ